MTRPGISYALGVLVVVLDQASKYWIMQVDRLGDRITQPLLGPLRLTMVQNRGVSFGVMNGGLDWTRWAFAAFSLAAAVGLAVWARRTERLNLLVAIGLIMGGAVGNAIDRIRLGWVTDFIDASGLYFPWVFNVADSAITVGAILLIWDLFLTPRKGAAA